MSISDYFAAVRRHASLVVATILLTTAVAAGAWMLIPRNYSATAQLYITLAPGTVASDVDSSTTFAKNQMVSFAQLANSRLILDPVISRLGVETSPEILSSRVSASSVVDSTILNVTVVSDTPQEASNLANGVVEQLAARVSDFSPTSSTTDGRKTLSAYVVSPAVPPATPATVSLRVALLIGGGIGLLSGLTLAVARDVARRQETPQGATADPERPRRYPEPEKCRTEEIDQ